LRGHTGVKRVIVQIRSLRDAGLEDGGVVRLQAQKAFDVDARNVLGVQLEAVD